MNIDFSASPGFSAYVVLLLISGVAMLVIAALNSGGQSAGWRIFNAVVGVAFLGYGVYLAFVFTGGTYLIVFKAFILPIVLIVNFFRSLRARNTDAAAPSPYVPAQQYDAAAPSPYLPAQQPYGQVPQYQPVQPPAQPNQPPVPQAPQG